MKRYIIVFTSSGRQFVTRVEANNDTQALANFVEDFGTFRTPIAIGRIDNLTLNNESNSALWPVTTTDPRFRIDKSNS